MTDAAAIPRNAPPAAPPVPQEPVYDREAELARALQVGARPLIALATQLRRVVVDSPEGMKQALAAAVQRFEAELTVAGWDARGISAASYVLCAWVDEEVADTPWGAGGAGLLQRFHGEPGGRDRVLQLLSRLAEQPRQNRALLELFHACLSLGLHGHLRNTPETTQQLEQLRARVFLTLPHDTPTLSPPWQAALKPGVPIWRRRLALGALLLLGLATLGVYTGSHLLLAARVDAVFASMQQIAAGAQEGAGAAGAAPAPVPALPAVTRLAPLLAGEIGEGRVQVRDEAHRSVVSVPAEQLFDAGSTQLAASAAPLVARIGTALAGFSGKVLVIGHTDGSDPRSARLPSAWHQSYEWARETANGLARTLPADRLAVEGAADIQQPAETSLPRRRVDIVLFP